MTVALQAGRPAAGSDATSFELAAIERTADARLELHGRWYGVRGRRFVRPTLTVATEDGVYRLLADLEHKPWAAEDGQPWVVAFPWALGDTTPVGLELAVASGIEISLLTREDAVDADEESAPTPDPAAELRS